MSKYLGAGFCVDGRVITPFAPTLFCTASDLKYQTAFVSYMHACTPPSAYFIHNVIVLVTLTRLCANLLNDRRCGAVFILNAFFLHVRASKHYRAHTSSHISNQTWDVTKGPNTSEYLGAGFCVDGRVITPFSPTLLCTASDSLHEETPHQLHQRY